MAATATAKTAAPARRAPARKPAPRKPAPRRNPAPARRRRRGNTPITGFVPVAVGRTAGAVGGLADSGLVVRLTRGRLWIGLLGGLLVGIVALNVAALSFSASSSDAARQAETIERQNSALRGEIASLLSSSEVQAAATKLGLVIPEPGSIRYLRPRSGDAAAAAKRLRDGSLTSSEYVAPVAAAPIVPAEEAVVEEPLADPAAVAPETAEPVAPVEAAPVEPAVPATPADGGGVAAP